MLEHDRKSFSMSESDAKKYQKKHIFILPMSKVHMLPAQEDDNGNVVNPRTVGVPRGNYIPTFYKYNKDGKASGLEAILRYYKSKTPMVGIPGEYDYFPLYINIVDGALRVENDPQLAFFLDNHSNNEKVVKDRTHGAWVPNADTIFKTWNPEEIADERERYHFADNEIYGYLLGKNKMSEIELRALAKTINASPSFPVIFNLEDMSDKMLRGRLMDIAKSRVIDFHTLIMSDRATVHEQVEKMLHHEILYFDQSNNAWAEILQDGTKEHFVTVNTGEDRTEKIVKWLDEAGFTNPRAKRMLAALDKKSKLQEAS